MFQDIASHRSLLALEACWQDILKELKGLTRDQFSEWPEQNIYSGDWSVFGLYAFGLRIDDNCAACPTTAASVEAIPGLVTAGFSAMAPNTHILPHRGYTGAVLRCHLGLVVPPDSALRVGTEQRSWEPGKLLLFDDTSEHEAWNRSDSVRVVLLLDFKKDIEVQFTPDDLPDWFPGFADL